MKAMEENIASPQPNIQIGKGDSAMAEMNKEWFREAKFGMFIHWGLYSITARDMWYYSTEQVDKERYESLFDRFNPMDYNPEDWASLAKKAGMKYAVLTAKHHDGFCLWDSKYTDFKVTNTPYGKDLIKRWVDAFRREGLNIGFYYSLLDWHHPHFTVDYYHPQRGRMDELNRDRDFSVYQEYLYNQVCELMSEFGKMDILWFDFSYGEQPGTGLPGKAGKDWKAMELVEKVLQLQPGILINNRLDILSNGFSKDDVPKELRGDFATPEQYIPGDNPSSVLGKPNMWEACETMGASWGYCRGDGSIKSVQEILKHLVTCTSGDGNLLLNVGPTPRGKIQPEFVERLNEVGKWLEINGESVYGAVSSKYKFSLNCPEFNPIFTQRGKNLYMHLLHGKYYPYNVVLNGLGGKVEYIEFVSDKTIVEFDEVEWDGMKHIRLHMPVANPDPYDTVIRIVLNCEI